MQKDKGSVNSEAQDGSGGAGLGVATQGSRRLRFGRRGGMIVLGLLAVAGGLLFLAKGKSPKAGDEAGAGVSVQQNSAGFAASIIVYDNRPAAAPAGARHQIKVNVTADGDGHVALFRQQDEPQPVLVGSLEYKQAQGDMHMLEENAASGTRYCIIGARDQEGLKHLAEVIGQIWAYLPPNACYSVP